MSPTLVQDEFGCRSNASARYSRFRRAWTSGRDLRPIESKSFHELWAKLNNDSATKQFWVRFVRISRPVCLTTQRELALISAGKSCNPVSITTTAIFDSFDIFKQNLEAVDGHCIIAKTTPKSLEPLHKSSAICKKQTCARNASRSQTCPKSNA